MTVTSTRYKSQWINVSEDIEWRSRNLQVAMKGILGKNERGKIKGYHLNLTVLFIYPPRHTPSPP